AEEQEAKAEVAEQCKETDEGHRDCRDQDVVVANVAEFMPENTLELGAVHDLEQAGRDRYGRVLRVAPGSERVQRRIVNHIDTRLRETDADAELLNHVMKLLKLVRIRFPSPGSRDCEPVRIEVAHPDQADRNEEGDKDEEGPELEEQVEGYDRSRDEDREPDHQIHSPALVRPDLRHQVSALGHVTSSQIVFRTRAGPPSRRTRSRGIGVYRLGCSVAFGDADLTEKSTFPASSVNTSTRHALPPRRCQFTVIGQRTRGQHLSAGPSDLLLRWWRGRDLNPRPSGYEPGELPNCSHPRRPRQRTTRRQIGPSGTFGPSR